jgi:hypothetical protein
MNRAIPRLLVALVALVALVVFVGVGGACGGRSTDISEASPPAAKPGANLKGLAKEAQASYPRIIDMHQKIVGRSCAPNAGVCHNTSNYPDLQSTGALIAAIGAWCNIAIPDPTMGFDRCERVGDVLVVADTLATEIAWVDRLGLNQWRFGTRDAAPVEIVDGAVYFFADMAFEDPVLLPAEEWLVSVDMSLGSHEAIVSIDGLADNPFIADFVDTALLSIIPGDPNRNGSFGADDSDIEQRATVIAAGSLEMSYLWGRITGTVPGSRMPLANQALTEAEYVAVACFIEGLADHPNPRPEDAIDYAGCAYAEEPGAFAIE